MSTRQAEDILKHTFKQLEKMLREVDRQKAAARPEGKSADRRLRDASGRKRK